MMTKIQKKKLLLASSNVLTDFLKNYSKAGQQIHCLGHNFLAFPFYNCLQDLIQLDMTETFVQPSSSREITLIQHLLALHDKAVLEIIHINEYTTQLTKQAITAMKTGNKGKALQLLKHRCVADGIKHMYRQYRQLKWTQARRLALSVASTINPNLPLPHRPHDNQEGVEEIQVEKYAQTMMVAQCNFSRNS